MDVDFDNLLSGFVGPYGAASNGGDGDGGGIDIDYTIICKW